MGKRGPRAKPTSVKRAEGNPGRRPLPDSEPEPEILRAIPAPPDWFDEVARETWFSVCHELKAVDLLNNLDLTAVEQYCVVYSQWRKMLGELEKHGHTYTLKDKEGNPRYISPTAFATLCRQYAADVYKWSKVLGIGPANRVGMTGSSANQNSGPDPIADELEGTNSGADHNPPPRRKRASKKKAS